LPRSTVHFIDALNSVLKRNGIIQGATGDITTLTATAGSSNTAHAREISTAIDVLNEGIHHVYDLGLFPMETSTATIVGVSGTREYSKPSDYVRMAGTRPATRVFRGATNNFTLSEYPGGYEQMLVDQLTATDYTGTPRYFAENTTSGDWRFDTENDDTQTATSTWRLLYEKSLRYTTTSSTTSTATGAADNFPFSDEVVDAMVPVWAEFHQQAMKKEVDPGKFKNAVARAVRKLRQDQPMERYGKRRAR